MTCPTAPEVLVAYFAGDLARPDENTLEEHLFGCEACARAAARIAAVTETIRADIPPVVTADRVERLRAKGLRVRENPMLPGDRKEAFFAPGVDLLVHRLGGLDLTRATRVGFSIGPEGPGGAFYTNDDAPFDRDAGAVLVACQRHYELFPHDTVAEVRVTDASNRETVARYTILHRF